MFAFKLCRAVGCSHPDKLGLTAEQFFDWWMVWNDEPWGDERDDLRTWAHAGLMLGMREMEPHWPYFPREWTVEEIRERTAEIEAELERKRNGLSS